ncbi:ABC transporter substrate-binding protein [Marinomonas dokdonensis]|uniref:ABC transporter substrate-binding protein n=1 Tax=Marinomonas dokdonensis TaxID=328224 RepID=UPI004055570A
MKLKTASLLLMLTITPLSYAKDFSIGLNSDPDALDPDLGRTMAGREVFTSLFDKLIEIDQELNLVPMLATSWKWVDENKGLILTLREGVSFHDGTPFNAEAVKFNINRSMTLEGSRRKTELAMVDHVEILDNYTVKIHLKQAFVPLLATLTDRSGMMVSPVAAKKLGKNFGQNPVGTGPYKFESRVPQDRIVLDRFSGYWEAEHYHFDKVTYLPLPDATIRLANLRSGQIDIAERVLPTDIESIKTDSNLHVLETAGLGYNGITFNLGFGAYENKDMAIKNPLVRKAFEYAIDRNVLNQVVFAGQYVPDNQWVTPGSTFYANHLTMPARNIETAKEILATAGYKNGVSIELTIANTTEATQIGQVVQAMASEAGIRIELNTMDNATALDAKSRGEYEATIVGWSGRVDPDSNIYSFYGDGGPLNENGFDDESIQNLLVEARSEPDISKRQALYSNAMEQVLEMRPQLYLYHPKWQWGVSNKIEGFKPYADGMPRLRDVK